METTIKEKGKFSIINLINKKIKEADSFNNYELALKTKLTILKMLNNKL